MSDRWNELQLMSMLQPDTNPSSNNASSSSTSDPCDNQSLPTRSGAEYSSWSIHHMIAQELQCRSRIAVNAAALTRLQKVEPDDPTTTLRFNITLNEIYSSLAMLNTLRFEFNKRQLSADEKSQRDIQIPLTVAAANYLISLGVAQPQEFFGPSQPAPQDGQLSNDSS